MNAYPEWVTLLDLLPWTPEECCSERARWDNNVFDVYYVVQYREGYWGQPSRFGDPVAACTTRESAQAAKRLMEMSQ